MLLQAVRVRVCERVCARFSVPHTHSTTCSLNVLLQVRDQDYKMSIMDKQNQELAEALARKVIAAIAEYMSGLPAGRIMLFL